MFNGHVKFDSIKGDNTDKDHKDQCVITGFRFSVSQPPGPMHAAGHRTAEAVQISEFEIDKLHDSASPKLLEAACNGTNLAEVTIELVKAGGKPLKYTVIKLKNVLISGIYHSADTNGTNQFPTETVKMTFQHVEWTFTKQKETGEAAGNTAMKYDVLQAAVA